MTARVCNAPAQKGGAPENGHGFISGRVFFLMGAFFLGGGGGRISTLAGVACGRCSKLFYQNAAL